jgi:hypothetical protein
MRSIRRRSIALALATCAVAVAAPVSGASAADAPVLPGVATPAGGVFIGGNQIGSALCIGTNRPSYGGNSASTSAQNCGAPGYQGAHVGGINGLVGPVVTNSVAPLINTSNSSITY